MVPFRAMGTVADARESHGEIEVLWDRTKLPIPHLVDRLVLIEPEIEPLFTDR